MILTPDKKQFLNDCKKVLEKYGEKSDITVLGDKTGKSIVYEDTVIYLACSEDGVYMEVDRKKNESPVIFVEKGEVTLFHGEFIYLTDHVGYLLS